MLDSYTQIAQLVKSGWRHQHVLFVITNIDFTTSRKQRSRYTPVGGATGPGIAAELIVPGTMVPEVVPGGGR